MSGAPAAGRAPGRTSSLARVGRRGEPWTRSQAAKNDLIALSVRAGFRFTDRLPERLLPVLGRWVGRFAGLILRRFREDALRRARTLLAEAPARRASRLCFERAGEHLALCLLLRRPELRASRYVHVPQATLDVLDGVLSQGRGAVFVSAHLGPFEHLAAVVAELGYRPAVVVRESYDPRLDEWVDAHRHLHGVGVIHRGDPRAAAQIVRALRAGRPVGFLPDLGGRVPGVPLNFMGSRVAFPVGPQRIAKRARAPLVVGWLARRATLAETPFELRLVEVDTAGDVDELSHRVAITLEQAIAGSAIEDWLGLASPKA